MRNLAADRKAGVFVTGCANAESADGNISLKVKAPQNTFTGGLKHYRRTHA